MSRNRWIIIVVAGVVVLVALGVVANAFFLPEGSDRVQEDLSMTMDATVVQTGGFRDGDSSHHVSGQVDIIEMGSVHYLRFKDYRQTSGPDVFVYLTEKPHTRDPDEVESGLRVLIDGGRDGGESTKEGDFLQELPVDFDPAGYHGIAIWCDMWDVLFGYAELTTPA